MEFKLVEDKAFLKKDCWRSRARNQKATRCNLLEAIAQMHGGGVVSHTDEDGAVKMKIVVRRQDLKHMLAMVGGIKNSNQQLSMSSLEQRLYVMRRRHLRRTDHVKANHSNWRPVLQSIPEEL